MRKFIGRVLAWIGGLTLAFWILVFIGATFLQAGKGKVPAKTILELNLETNVTEFASPDPIARLSSNAPVLRDIVEALDKARTDSRVLGLYARIGNAGISTAQAQEIRDAILAFRQSKKFAIAFAETFGEFSPGNGSYYLATAFDEIWLQPSGDVGLTGLAAESMFLRGLFDKLGMTPRMGQRYEYKNAMNMYTEKKFTAPHREATDKLIQGIFSQMVDGIASGRKLPPATIRQLADQGPFLGPEAQKHKLVDGLAYRDEIIAKAKSKAGSNADFLFLSKYLDRAGRPHQNGPVIALIHGVGAVQRGSGDFDPFSGSSAMGSDTVTAAFRQAIADKAVKAILFRVDSPGGSYVASDAIWRETIRAKQAGKPVIVSMSGVAASGGYFVAMNADKIVAHPATITGSIGVLGGKVLTNGLWDKIGISWDEVHTSRNARMFSSTSDFSKEEWDRFQAWLDRVYDDFTSKVAAGRRLPKDKVLAIAKGRVWTGQDAKAIGLVDELGGYPVALKLARQAINLKDDAPISIRAFPKEKTTFEALMARLEKREEGDSSESPSSAAALRILREVRPVIQLLRALTQAEEPGVLTSPQVKILP